MSKFLRMIVAGTAVFALTGTVMAQMNIGFNGIGAKIGYISPSDNIESTIGFGVVADLGTVSNNLHLRAGLDYWSKSYGSALGGGSVSFSEMVLGAQVLYYFPAKNSSFMPYAGGGLDFTRGSAKVDLGPYGSSSSSDTKIGFDLVGGADYPLSPQMTGFAELKYHADGTDYFAVFGGVIYQLSK